VFDAESWGLFHYLLLGDNGAHRAQLGTYLDLLAHGKNQLEAGKEAFGDLKKLQEKIGFYYAQRAFPFAQLDLVQEGFAAQLSIRSLTLAESNSWLAEYHLRFKRQAVAKPLIDAALAANPDEPRAHEALGLYDMELADYENATKEFSTARSHDSSLYLAYYYSGILSSYWKAPAQIPPSSEQDLRRSLEIAPRYAPAALAVARLIVRRGGNLTEAVEFARRAVEAEPGTPRYEIAYANILLPAGDRNQAESQARQALADELSPLEEEAANNILRLAQDCKPGEACKTLGHMEFGSPADSPTAVPAGSPAPGAASPDPTIQLSRLWGVVRSIACTPEGRIFTLASGEKDLTFNTTKTTRVTWPETFWLDPAYLDVCKHFAGETAAIKYKDATPGSAFQDATALEIQDRF
jgi:Tfp pilus assembly protein PilF